MRPVQAFVAGGTQGNQILLRIISALAAELLVVNLQIQPASATLAPPAVTP
jgi:hypothetical protein